jgi:hypothetical protein
MNYVPVPIDAETRGRRRLYKAKLSERYRRLDRAFHAPAISTDANAFSIRRNVIGRNRAFTRLATAFGGAGAVLEGVRLTGRHPMAVWAVLKPRDSMITNADDDPSLSQDCVMVNYLVAGAIPPHASVGHAALWEGAWTLEIQDHALAVC